MQSNLCLVHSKCSVNVRCNDDDDNFAIEDSSQHYRKVSSYPETKSSSALAKAGARSGALCESSLAILEGCVWPQVWQGQSRAELFTANL